MDVSNSMLASSTDDPRGISRLQRAKLVLEKLFSQLKNDKVGLIVFAGDAYTQLPITSDFTSAKMFLSSISPDMVPTQGYGYRCSHRNGNDFLYAGSRHAEGDNSNNRRREL